MSTASGNSLNALLTTAAAWLSEHAVEVSDLSDAIWRFAEPGLREERSCAALCGFLREAGFSITEAPSGMPTAFVANWGSGNPVIGLMCEYDATPGDSQAPVPYPDPIAPEACGFPDLHNGIGAASAGAAIAARQALERHGLVGTIRVFGTPAEKLCVGKPFLARDGYFDGLDAVLAWHPRPYNTVEWDAGPGCYEAQVFDFTGVSAYASAPWAGVSALDALMLMNVIVQFMREHMPRQFLASVNELVTIGGQHPTSLPLHTQVWYVYRSPVREGILHVQDLLRRAADAACLATGATYSRQVVALTRPWVPNHVLARLAYRNLERAGAPCFSQEMKTFGRSMLQHLGLLDEDPFDEQLTPPDAGITTEFAGGADDVTEFTWHAPTARIYVAHGLRAGRLPNWTGAALSGTAAAHETVATAARALAFGVLDAMAHPEELDEARVEFRQRTSTHEMPPLLPADARPPIDLNFPPHYPATWRPPAARGTATERVDAR